VRFVSFDQFVLAFVFAMRKEYPGFRIYLTPQRVKTLLRAYTSFLRLAPYPSMASIYFDYVLSNYPYSSVDLILRAIARKKTIKEFLQWADSHSEEKSRWMT